MKETQKLFLELILVALDKRECLSRSPTDEEWDEMYLLATKQPAIALCAPAFNKLQKYGQLPSFKRKMRWLGMAKYKRDLYYMSKDMICELAELYQRHNISMMVLKGYGLSLNWPNPQLRETGDLDIFLMDSVPSPTNGNRSKDGTCDLEERDGMPLWKYGDGIIEKELGLNIERDHHHHTFFIYKKIIVENHYDFINVHAHRDAPGIEAKLKELAFKEPSVQRMNRPDAKGKETSSVEILLPSPDFNVIFLIRHMGQHFAGEYISIRQVLDWAFFLERYGDTVNWKVILPYLRQINIYQFFCYVNVVCAKYFCFESFRAKDWFDDRDIDPVIEELMINDILSPKYAVDEPKYFFPRIIFKMRRWWDNRWKHPMVYHEWLLPMLLTLMWSHIKGPKISK